MDLAADANVLLSALVGGAAGRILTHPEVHALVPTPIVREIEDYLPDLALRRRLDIHLLQLTLAALPIEIVERTVYRRQLSEARRRIASRDPADADLLALALALRIPIWSNDRDFEIARVKWFTTAQLLKHLNR